MSDSETSEMDSVANPADLAGQALADFLQLPYAETLEDHEPEALFLERIPIGFAREKKILGLRPENSSSDQITVAFADAASWPDLDVVSRRLGQTIQPLVVPAAEILKAINEAYQSRSGQAQAVLDAISSNDVSLGNSLKLREDLLDATGKAPVVELVNSILFEAVKTKSSDLHIQPYEESLVIRLRIDGVLFDAFDIPKPLQDELTSRVKVIGNMNIAEKRIPQDGRASVNVGDRLVDLRIASLPTAFGERIVIRLLDKGARAYTLGELGMGPDTLAEFRRIIGLEHGLILVTGPTGSGKSTTLYGALGEIDAKERNVLTLEDPIEYQLPGVSQTQVNEKTGLTFASGLRNVLRQDPDIIMIGEIRDQETASMAIQSSLTGHLVFSTLHTNDSAGAVTRLLDLGVEPYLVSSSLVGVMAQRLVRRTCSQCETPDQPSTEALASLGLTADDTAGSKLKRAIGCDACRNTGYEGRVGLYELLIVQDEVRQLIQARGNASEIRQAASTYGMKSLRDDGVEKALAGMTSIEEVVRVTMRA